MPLPMTYVRRTVKCHPDMFQTWMPTIQVKQRAMSHSADCQACREAAVWMYLAQKNAPVRPVMNVMISYVMC